MRIELMDQFLTLAGEHDVIFTASSAVDPIICKDDLAKMSVCGDVVGGKRRLVDIAVPRNVDANCCEDANTLVYNVDDLKELAEINKAKREAAGLEAEALLLEEQRNFEAWRDSLETVPTIKRLRQKAENIRSAELDKAMTKLGEGIDEQAKEGRRGTLPGHHQQDFARPDGGASLGWLRPHRRRFDPRQYARTRAYVRFAQRRGRLSSRRQLSPIIIARKRDFTLISPSLAPDGRRCLSRISTNTTESFEPHSSPIARARGGAAD